MNQYRTSDNYINNPMTRKVIISALIVVLALTCCIVTGASAAAATRHQASSYFDASAATTTTTTEAAPVFSIEDPANSATTSDSEYDSEICFRCYEEVKRSQKLMAIQESLVNKQIKLIKQKQKAAVAAASAAATASASTTTTTTNAPTQTPMRRLKPRHNSTQPESVLNRWPAVPTATNVARRSLETDQIVVSRLRVARSPYPAATYDSFIDLSSTASLGNRNLRIPKSMSKDPAIKQLKHKQEQQLNETCKSLHETQQCLDRISKECLGDLQYHSQDVYTKQMFKGLGCLMINDKIKPWPHLTREFPRVQELEKTPAARSISTEEEIKRKLDQMFGNRNKGQPPLGVMLKPTPFKSGPQQINSISEPGQQQQQFAQMASGYPIDGGYPTKGRHLQIMPLSGQRASSGQLVGVASQMLLIPAFLIFVVLFVIMANRYFKNTRV